MKTSLFILLLFMSSFAQALLIEEPMGCIKTPTAVCAIKSIGQSYEIQQKNAQIYLANDSIIIRKKMDEIVLVQGHAYVSSLSAPFVFQTEYVNVKSAKGGFWIFKNNKNQTVVRNIESVDLALTGRGDESLPTIIIGFENWYAGLNSSKQQLSGILKPIEFSGYMKEHLQIVSSPSDKVVQDLKRIKAQWDQNQQVTSQIYQQVVQRNIAKESDQDAELVIEKNIKNEESQRMKQLFRQKNFIDSDLIKEQ